MSQDLHHLEDLFRSAYRQSAEEPSPESWEKISNLLNEKEVRRLGKAMSAWRSVAVCLLLALTGLVVSETKNQGNNIRNIKVAEKKTVHQNELPVQMRERHTAMQPGSSEEAFRQPGITATEDRKVPAPERKNPPLVSSQGLSAKILRDASVSSIGNEKVRAGYPPASTAQASRFGQIPVSSFLKAISPAQLLTKTGGPAAVAISVPYHFNTGSSPKRQARHFPSKWTLSALVSPDRAAYRLDINEPNNIDQQNGKAHIGQREEHEPSFSLALLLSRSIGKHWGLMSGFIYSNTAIVIQPQNMHAVALPNGDVYFKYITSSGYAYIKPGFGANPALGDSLSSSQAQHNLQYGSLPLLVRYSVGKGRLTAGVAAGIAANILIHARVKIEVADALNRESVFINKLNGMKSGYLSFVSLVDLHYRLAERWTINLTPSFRYAITPITTNNIVQTFPYSAGVGAGVSYNF